MLTICRHLVFAVALVCVVAGAGAAAVPDASLDARVELLRRVLDGKRLRHRVVRDALSPLFANADGRDRFLLNLVALVDRAGIQEARLRRVSVIEREQDDTYGYARQKLKLCGRWYLWLPRCVDLEVRWRRVEDAWVLLPPDEIRLDPEVRHRLRAL